MCKQKVVQDAIIPMEVNNSKRKNTNLFRIPKQSTVYILE